MQICASGPITGKHCSGVVTFVNDCYVFPGGAVTRNVSAVFSQTTRRSTSSSRPQGSVAQTPYVRCDPDAVIIGAVTLDAQASV